MEHDRDSYSYSWLSLRFGLPLFFVSQNAMPAEAAGGDGVLAVAGRGEGRENKWACARRSACYELRCLLLLSPPPLSSSSTLVAAPRDADHLQAWRHPKSLPKAPVQPAAAR